MEVQCPLAQSGMGIRKREVTSARRRSWERRLDMSVQGLRSPKDFEICGKSKK